MPRPITLPAASAIAARQLDPPPSMPIASSVIEPPNIVVPSFFITIPKKYHLPRGEPTESFSFYPIDFKQKNSFDEFSQSQKLNSAGQLVFFWT
jgi:hypothetical protein